MRFIVDDNRHAIYIRDTMSDNQEMAVELPKIGDDFWDSTVVANRAKVIAHALNNSLDELPSQYRVTWEIDVESSGDDEFDTPDEAARYAAQCMYDPRALPPIFDVVDREGNRTEVEIDPEDL